MKIKIIGVGAAGNKSVINLINKGIVSTDDVLILNSTLRDVPMEFKKNAVQYNNSTGAGKNRDQGYQLLMASIQDGTLDCLDTLVDEDTSSVLLVGSTEGGTGSSAIPTLAKYYYNVLDIPVHCVALTGFEEDGRGLQNTIEFFQELTDEYTIEIISNKRFLDDCNGNKLKAEKAANDELATRVALLTGKNIIESEQNIDETDLFKVVTTPGYMMLGATEIDKSMKTTDSLNRLMDDLIDETKSFDPKDNSIKRLAMFINIHPKKTDLIDYNFSVMKEKLGVPYEVFTHIQYDDSKPETLSFIASGMNMPLNEVKAISEKYNKETEKINTNKDSFFDFTANLQKDNKKANFFKEAFNTTEMQTPKKEASEIKESKKNFMQDAGVAIVRRKKPTTVVSDSLDNGNGNTNHHKMTREQYLENKLY